MSDFSPASRRVCALLLVALFASPGTLAAPAAMADGPRVGLVLSGGGARGAAHIGVLKVLEELRIPVHAVSGTSMGAIVGGLYASGLNAAAIEDVLNDIDWEDVFRDTPVREDLAFRRKEDDLDSLAQIDIGIQHGKLVLPRGLIQGQKLNLELRKRTLHVAGIDDFDKLPIPFRAVATDIGTGAAVALDRGDLALAMRASMSVPAAIAPVEIDGRLLVDGGLANNLPVDVVRRMGVDVVIAVDISAPLRPADELVSAFAIADQIVTIFVRRETDQQIARMSPQDFRIAPDLGGFSAADFVNAHKVIAPGEAATRAQRAGLLTLARTPTEYARWQAAHQRPIKAWPTIEFLRVVNDSRISEKVLLARLDTVVGEPLNVETLERDLARLYGMESFETVGARLLHSDGQVGLELNTKQKTWGPNYLRFGLRLEDDFEGGSSYNLNARLTFSDLNPLGGELRSDLQVGRLPAFESELYQPLTYSSSFFVAPRVSLTQRNLGLFDAGVRAAELLAREATLGLDVGYEFGNWGELRGGIRRGIGRGSLRTGDPALLPAAVDDIDIGNWSMGFAYDRLDDVNFPRVGRRLNLQAELAKDGLGSSESFDLFTAQWAQANTWGRHTLVNTLNVGTVGGAAVDNIQNLFQIGGFLNLSGLSQDELLGPHFAVGQLIYYRRFGRLEGGLFDLPVYLGGSIEIGNVWQSRSDVSLDTTLKTASVFLGIDSALGPLWLSTGFAEGGRSAHYLFLGRGF